MSVQRVLIQLPGDHLLLTHDVHPVFTDSGEDIAGYPILEGAGLGLIGAHDEAVETAFGDEGHTRGKAEAPTLLKSGLCLNALVAFVNKPKLVLVATAGMRSEP